MSEYREVIRRLQKSQSIRGIQKETGMHRTIIRKILKYAAENGWLHPGSHIPNEESLYKIWGKSATLNSHPLDGWQDKIREWLDEDYSYVVIHRLILPEYECSEATIRRYIKKHFPGYRKAVIRRETIPGEVMEVDFGHLGLTFDPISGKNRKTYFFSGRLRHSRDAYREIVFNQDQQTFFRCHINAFEYFGGVPSKLVPDNLKAAVIRASYENPIINRVYRKLAEHYDFMISPTLPGMPEHKGGVENDVKYVKNNFWPVFKEQQKSKGYSRPNADELKAELDAWNRTVARVRKIGGLGRSPAELFENEEKDRLQPLPQTRWRPMEWKQDVTARDTCRIQYDNAFYSIPYKYIGRKVYVLTDPSSVYIFCDHEQIALHRKAKYKWEVVKKPEHFPPHAEEYMSTTRESLKKQAQCIGDYTGKVVSRILDEKHVDGLRPARAILYGLGKKYGERRLEAACRRAWTYDTAEYASVKSILVGGLDKLDIEHPVDATGQQLFQFVREYGYFDPANHADDQEDPVWTN